VTIPTPATRLAGLTALITGGATGIGRAISESFSREGAKVAIAARRKDKLDEAVAAITSQGREALAIECDVSSSRDAERAIQETVSHFGALNILVNNAGIWSAATVEQISEADWDRVMKINVNGPFLMSRAALPALRKSGGGSIINTGSVLGLYAMKNRAAYCASKGAVTMLTKAMALDHAHENIRVNCICPSLVETEMVQSLFPDTVSGHAARQARLATIPIGRMGRPADVAALAVYLASPESSWLTGVAIPLDGGLSAS
jgi:NAD(P)-dependent dehydrogenase (short-subunit alcohol dehydrogenase family)